MSEGLRSSLNKRLYRRFRSCESARLGMPVEALDDGVGKGDRSGAVDRAADGKKFNAIGDKAASELIRVRCRRYGICRRSKTEGVEG